MANGDSVSAGDVLVTLDPTEESLTQAEAALQMIESALARTCFRAGIVVLGLPFEQASDIVDRAIKDAMKELIPYASGVNLEEVAHNQRLAVMAELTAIHQARTAAEYDSRQRQNDVNALVADVDGIRGRLPLLAERELVLREMLQKTLTEHWRWLDANLSLLEARQELRSGLHRMSDGVVSDLALYTTGGVLAAGEVAMTIVPDGVDLELQALALNKDIGEIREGQDVKVKIEAFPFTRYGLIDGRVRNIAHTAVADDELGFVYPVHVVLDRQQIVLADRLVDLSAGMTATGEIHIGDRRVVDFFMSPFQRYQDEALRER
ncbi:MAG: HlyD family efflux transporter periplasmic adaptor subunit [Alphaproteobacteria bacterium GM202ARS2]|nr:HlyD family efflux transporter periplasmic adaptor subunit [Alphaproteobacteria bacterium GM202ARS2]